MADLPDQLTFESLAARTVDAQQFAEEQLGELREAVGALAKMSVLERYALVTLARQLVAQGKNKRGIKRAAERLMDIKK